MRLHRFLIGQIEVLLGDVLKFSSAADVATSRFFHAHPKLGQTERSIATEAVFSVLRRKIEYEYLAESGSGTLTRRLALLGLMQTAGLKELRPYVFQEEYAWLDLVSKVDPESLPAHVRTNFPSWIEAALGVRLTTIDAGPDAVAQELAWLAAALNHPAPLDLRVNPIRAHRDAVLAVLAQVGVQAEPTPYAPLGIRIAGKPAIRTMTAFKQGWFEIQDEGSQLLCQLTGPCRGEMVVDFCAGAGGKTLALGAMMHSTGRLYAFDVSDKRLGKLKIRLSRSGLSNVHPVLIDSEFDIKIKRLFGKIDRVLVDVPCTGIGTLRRNPDLKWRQTPQSVDKLAVKQASILSAAARLLKPGGRLVYATCSLLSNENEEIIEQFIATHPMFECVSAHRVLADKKIALDTGKYLILWPHRHGTDGFFAVAMQRVA